MLRELGILALFHFESWPRLVFVADGMKEHASAIGFRSGSFSFVTISLDVQKSHKVHTKTPQRRFIHATPSV